jgi:hypothetical protein
MASSESNRIGSITAINSTNIRNLTSVNSSINSITSILNYQSREATFDESLKKLLIISKFMQTPIKNDNLSQIGFLDIYEYADYLKKNGVEQFMSQDSILNINGTYTDNNILITLSISESNKQLNCALNLNKNLLVLKGDISDESFDGEIKGFVSGEKDKSLGLIGQENISGKLSINIKGTVSNGDLEAIIRGSFSGEFDGIINDTIISKSGIINQKIFIKIQHTNYIK